MKGKNLFRGTSIFLVSAIVFSFFNADQQVKANFEGYQPNCIQKNGGSDDESSGDDSPDATGGKAGKWTEDGTKANKIAQDMWDYWEDKGFSGAAIAGVMGNVAQEGGFDIPDRAEGHYGGDSKKDGISKGNTPETMDHYPTGESGEKEGGAGHYQFTPFSKFASEGDSKWESTEKQSDFVWSSEVKDAGWLDDYIELDSVDEAVDMWFSKYERGMELDSEKIKSAKKAYKTFGGSDIKADSALANASDTAEKGAEEQEKKDQEQVCKGDSGGGSDSSSKSSSGGSSDLVSVAEDLLGYFDYVMVHGEDHIGSVDDPDKDGITDCSGFMWLVLKKEGYKAPDDMQWNTDSMEDDAKGDEEYIEEISEDEAKAGDMVIVTEDGKVGHTAFLMEDWKGEKPEDNTTKIIQMGGISMDGVSKDEFNSSFKSLVEGDPELTFAKAKKD